MLFEPPPPPAPALHLLHHLLQAGHVRRSPPSLHLLHHVLDPGHAAHLLQHPRVDHLRHLLVELSHLGRIDLVKGLLLRDIPAETVYLFVHISPLKEPLDSSHFLDDLRELGVLLEQLLHLPLLHPGPPSHSLHPVWFFTRNIGSQLEFFTAVEQFIIAQLLT